MSAADVYRRARLQVETNAGDGPDIKALRAAGGQDAVDLFTAWGHVHFRRLVKTTVLPAFRSSVDKTVDCGLDLRLHKAVSGLMDSIGPTLQQLVDLHPEESSRVAEKNLLLSILHAEILGAPDIELQSRYLNECRLTLGLMSALLSSDAESNESDMESGESGDEDDQVMRLSKKERTDVVTAFSKLNTELHYLGLFKVLAESGDLSGIIDSEITRKINKSCKGEFDEPMLPGLLQWVGIVRDWLGLLGTEELELGWLNAWGDQAKYLVYKSLAKLRIDEMFDIIVEFPDSKPAVVDLRECMGQCNQRRYLLDSLVAAFKKRLMLPGADTTAILTQYISAIKAIRVLDPSGIVLELVCAPVREYLRSRDDTVRCVVTSLVDDSNSELADELAGGELIELAESDESDGECDDGLEWTPDPVDTDPGTSRKRRMGDITSLLMNIYGSKEIFVNEYRSLLAERLLALEDFTIDKELRQHELLKLRFGEDHMQKCEVMLKDMADSKRISARIHEDVTLNENGETDSGDMDVNPSNKLAALQVFVLSRLFWPKFVSDEKLELPVEIKKAVDSYTKGYEQMKAARTLDFKPQLGTVSITIEFDAGGEKEFTVAPVLATMIMLFEEKTSWTLEEMSAKMQVPSATLQRKVGFWVGTGLLRPEEGGVYVLDESSCLSGGTEGGAVTHDDTIDGNPPSAASTMRDEAMETAWKFAQGMLNNFPSLGLDRIHQMLGMFIEGGFSESQADLKKFLDRKVNEGVLAYTAGEYKLLVK